MVGNGKLLGIVFALISCSQPPASSTQTQPAPVQEAFVARQDSFIDLPQLVNSERWDIPQAQYHVFDQVSKRDKSFEGYPLQELLRRWVDTLRWKPNLSMLEFECKDGYSPSMPLAKALQGKGLIAYREVGVDSTQNWPAGKESLFSPFYLVWDHPNKGVKGYPWPYGLVRLKLTNRNRTFATILPDSIPNLMKGFHLYETHCLKCHSINKVGGIMGPEFNYPRNITTYWSKADIWSFIQDPQSFRYNSKMPAITALSEGDFEKLYAYLSHMASKSL